MLNCAGRCSYDNPTFAILDTTNYSISPELTLTILLEAWPIGSYPYAVLLPSGSALIIAGGVLPGRGPCQSKYICVPHGQVQVRKALGHVVCIRADL